MPPDDRSDRNFVLQQGLPTPSPGTCRPLSAALRFQPRLTAPLVLVGTLTQSGTLFLALAALLYWGVLLPSLNPFDALYRATFGRAPTAVPLPPSPVPRRFSMALAGTVALLTGLAIHHGWWPATYALEAFFLIAVIAVAWGRLCFGSFLYLVVRGHIRFALQTLPWGRGV